MIDHTWAKGRRRKLRVTIGRETHEALVSDGSFAVESGQLAFAPGSSGWETDDGQRLFWMELFLRGGSACERFGRPAVGAEISLD